MIIFILRHIILTIAIVVMSIFFSILFLLRPTNRANTYYAAIIFSKVCRIILGIKVVVHNKERLDQARGSVIISNHQSNYDIFIVGEAIAKKTVSVGKKDILYFPFFGILYWLAGNILIDRKNKKSAWGTMEKVVNEIKKGINVWIMPEGTRSKQKGMLPFKRGPFVVAKKGDFDIYPICFSSYNQQLNFKKYNSGVVHISILPPINTKDFSDEEIDKLKEHAYEIMSKEIERLNKKVETA